jgi:hypothetical protein
MLLEEIEKKYGDYFHLAPIAFKGFSYSQGSGLNCRTECFKENEWNNHKNNLPLKLCSDTGYHFSINIYDVFQFYPISVNTRFFLIEYDPTNVILGGDKSITKKFKTLEDVSVYCGKNNVFEHQIEEIKRKHQRIWILNNYETFINKAKELIKLEEFKRIEKERKELLSKSKQLVIDEYEAKLKDEYQRMADSLGLHYVREIQERYPNVYIGGSLALFLHGMKIPRFFNRTSDIDLVVPYFHLFESSEGFTVKHENPKASGNDFDDTFILTTMSGSIKVDVKIDPMQAYEIVNFAGVNYKVTKAEKIWEAKLRYALKGNNKHLEDLKELMKVSSKSILSKNSDVSYNDIPF